MNYTAITIVALLCLLAGFIADRVLCNDEINAGKRDLNAIEQHRHEEMMLRLRNANDYNDD